MPFRRLFLSRWSALAWAAGMVWTAYDVADEAAPAGEPVAQNGSPTGEDGDAAQLNAVAALLNAG